MRVVYSSQAFNSLIVTLYLFLYALVVPFSLVTDGEILIVLATLILIFLAVFTNKFYNLRRGFIFIFPLCFLLLKLPFEIEGDVRPIFKNVVAYLTIGTSGIFLSSLSYSLDKVFYYGFQLAKLNLLVLGLIALSPFYGDHINYMKLGYSLLPSALFILIRLKNCKSVDSKHIFLFFSAVLLIFVYGSRGALVCAIFFTFSILLFGQISMHVKLIFGAICAALFSYIAPLFELLDSMLQYYDFSTYSLEKFTKLILDESTTIETTSSGRDEIYNSAFHRFTEFPFFGSPFNTCFLDTGVEYYHNFILDLVINFGLPITVCFFCGFVYFSYYRIKAKGVFELQFYLLLFTLSIVRLMMSSTFWQRPEFWFFMGYLVFSPGKFTKLGVVNYKPIT